MSVACSTHERDENCIRNLGRKREGKRSPGRRSRRWEDNVRMDLREIRWEVVDCIRQYPDGINGGLL